MSSSSRTTTSNDAGRLARAKELRVGYKKLAQWQREHQDEVQELLAMYEQ
ncbi:MAG: hypothetical protein Q8P93_01410 [bacterium]|nr:hypothetical protein [bacterium]